VNPASSTPFDEKIPNRVALAEEKPCFWTAKHLRDYTDHPLIWDGGVRSMALSYGCRLGFFGLISRVPSRNDTGPMTGIREKP
jgi:hypothetical protein